MQSTQPPHCKVVAADPGNNVKNPGECFVEAELMADFLSKSALVVAPSQTFALSIQIKQTTM